MGLGGAPNGWDDYEWVDLRALPSARASSRRSPVSGAVLDVREPLAVAPSEPLAVAPSEPLAVAPGEPLAVALSDWLERNVMWVPGPRTRVLLVDLDNLRADPKRWRARMAAVVTLARQADQVVLAGQRGAVRRGRPHLAEFAAGARAVADGSDVADHVLLDATDALAADAIQVTILSNDGIFASLADRGPLTVLSPGTEALSDRLRHAATRVVDLVALEEEAARDLAPAGTRRR